MNSTEQPAVAGPVEPTVRLGLPVVGCGWGGMVWLVSLRSPKKLDLGARLYSDAELDAAVAAERERIFAHIRSAMGHAEAGYDDVAWRLLASLVGPN